MEEKPGGRGFCGGGTVKSRWMRRKQVLSIKIDPEAVKSGDLEMLQISITAAINGAAIRWTSRESTMVGRMLGGMGFRDCKH
jgi:DNA-binding protein YbaB